MTSKPPSVIRLTSEHLRPQGDLGPLVLQAPQEELQQLTFLSRVRPEIRALLAPMVREVWRTPGQVGDAPFLRCCRSVGRWGRRMAEQRRQRPCGWGGGRAGRGQQWAGRATPSTEPRPLTLPFQPYQTTSLCVQSLSQSQPFPPQAPAVYST